jgi:hypothetical protein
MVVAGIWATDSRLLSQHYETILVLSEKKEAS